MAGRENESIMNSLSQKEKIEALEFAKLELEAGGISDCICRGVVRWIWIHKQRHVFTTNALYFIPELVDQKPKNKREGEFWWSRFTPQGKGRRLTAIRKTIESIQSDL